jgi:hypothetical protein
MSQTYLGDTCCSQVQWSRHIVFSVFLNRPARFYCWELLANNPRLADSKRRELTHPYLHKWHTGGRKVFSLSRDLRLSGYCWSDSADVLLWLSKAVVCTMASIPCRHQSEDAYDWFPVLGLFSRNVSVSRKERQSSNQSSWMAFSIQENKPTYAGRCKSSAKIHTVRWIGTWLLTMPILMAMLTGTVRWTPDTSVQFLASVALHGMYGCNRTLLYLTWIDANNEGTSNVKKMYPKERFVVLFPTNQ